MGLLRVRWGWAYRLAIGLSLWVIAGPSVRAQVPDTILRLWPPGTDCVLDEDPEFYQNDGIGKVYTRVVRPELHVYRPIPNFQTGGAVVIFPGGGYGINAYDWEGRIFANRLTAAGLTVFVSVYRLPGSYPASDCRSTVALADARRSVTLARRHAETYGIDPNRVAVMGFSAGGHLAASLAVHAATETERPNHAVLVYPVIDMKGAATHQGSRDNLLGKKAPSGLLDFYNLQDHVDSLTPPTLLVHASDDTGVVPDNALLIYRQLIAHGVPADLRIYHHGGHGFSLGLAFSGPVRHWTDDLVDWLTQWNYLDRE